MRRIRRHLTFANVVAAIALFLALGGGTAVALNGANTVFSDDIVNGEVKSPDLAKLAFTPVQPNPGTSADPCASGQTGVFCGTEGVFPRNWSNYGAPYGSVAYARDGLGLVHLHGTMVDVNNAVSRVSFILPLGYRPAATREFAVAYGQGNGCPTASCDERISVVQVRANGAVEPLSGQPGVGGDFAEGVSLDGVEFRAK